MSAEFSVNLSTLRKEKNISQKEAAEALGISQALLSHYEKGIRECSLDFVKKASEYYDVTADYLLGLSETRHVFNELLSPVELASDSGLNARTLLRCLLFLSQTAEDGGDAARMFFDDYFSVCISKYIALTEQDSHISAALCDMAASVLSGSGKAQQGKPAQRQERPLALKTVEQHCGMLITQSLRDFM